MLLGMLTIGLASADTAVLQGTMCNTSGRCESYTITLFDGLYFTDSKGRTGTWTMTELRGKQVFNWVLPGSPTLSDSIVEGPDNCWVDASSPLNPALGSINVCLTAPSLHALKPYNPTCDLGPLWTTGPAEGESGHWAAGRLTPENASGMWIHKVRYYLNSSDLNCGPIDHRVQVFLGSAAADPDGTPDVLYEFDVDGASLAPSDTYAELTLPDPVFVDGDESLFVSLEQLEIAGEQTCPAVCTLDPLVDDLSYWSNSAVTPYPWADLTSFGIERLMISGYGIVAGP